MPDEQALGLRAMFDRGTAPCVTLALCGSDSGRIAGQLAHALGSLGHRVLLLDRTRGEVATALGVKAKYDLAHAIDGHRRLADVVVDVTERVRLAAAARALDAIALGRADWQHALHVALPELEGAYDVWLINGPLPGAAPDARVLLAVAPTARAITAAYGHIKALAQAQGQRTFGVLVHHARDAEAARRVFDCVADTAGRFLSAELDFLGYVPRQGAQGRAIVAAAGSGPGAAFMTIARDLAAGFSSGASHAPLLP